MPRKKKLPEAVKTAEHKETTTPRISNVVLYSILISIIVVLISGAYYTSSECMGNCMGENITNGYPYPWFAYNTYEGWQAGNINWLGGILDVGFWAFITFFVMLVLYGAIKEF